MTRKLTLFVILIIMCVIFPINSYETTFDFGSVAFAEDASSISLVAMENNSYTKSFHMNPGETKEIALYRKVGSNYSAYTKYNTLRAVETSGIVVSSAINGKVVITVDDSILSGSYRLAGSDQKDFPVGSSNTITIVVDKISGLSYDDNLKTLSLNPGENKNIDINLIESFESANAYIGKGEIFVVDSDGNRANEIQLTASGTRQTTIHVDSNAKRGNIYYVIFDGKGFEKEDGIKIKVKESSTNVKKIKEEYKAKSVSTVNISASKDGIKVSWKKPSLNNKPTGYQLMRSTSKSSNFKTVYKGKKLSYQDQTGLTKGKTYYYKVRAYYDLGDQTVYTKWSAVKSEKALKTTTVSAYMKQYLSKFDDHTLLDNAELLTGNKIEWIKTIKSEDDFWNNVTYSCLIGNYELNFVFSKQEDAEKYGKVLKENFRQYIMANNAFVGAYTNAITEAKVSVSKIFDKWYKLSIKVEGACLNCDEVFQREVEAFNTARKIVDQLHSSGKITSSMSEYEIASVYNNYLIGLNVAVGIGGKYGHLKCLPYDDAYSSLISKVADCGGRAAGFNLLMNIEGINSVGLGVRGHIASLMIVDGKELANDWGNRHMLLPLSDFNKYFAEDTQSLVMSRKVLKWHE